MTKNRTVRLPDDLAADAEAVARVEGISVNEAVKQALVEAIERRRKDPKFRANLRRLVRQDEELLARPRDMTTSLQTPRVEPVEGVDGQSSPWLHLLQIRSPNVEVQCHERSGSSGAASRRP